MRELVLWSRRTILDTYRITATQVTFEHLFTMPDPDSTKGASLHASEAANALGIIDDHGARPLIQTHGFGHRTGTLTEGYLAVATYNGSAGAIFAGTEHLYPRSVGV